MLVEVKAEAEVVEEVTNFPARPEAPLQNPRLCSIVLPPYRSSLGSCRANPGMIYDHWGRRSRAVLQTAADSETCRRYR